MKILKRKKKKRRFKAPAWVSYAKLIAVLN